MDAVQASNQGKRGNKMNTNTELNHNDIVNGDELICTTEQNQSTQKGEKMEAKKHNPILEFVMNLTETFKYIWFHYASWIIDVSWGKLFLASLLILITGGLLHLTSLANWMVIGSLLLKCFIGKEDQIHQPKPESELPKEEN